MNAPSSLARRLSESLHGCPVCRASRFIRVISFLALGCFPSSRSQSPAWDFHRLFEFLGFFGSGRSGRRIATAGRTVPRLSHLYTPRRSFVRTLFPSRPSFELARPLESRQKFELVRRNRAANAAS